MTWETEQDALGAWYALRALRGVRVYTGRLLGPLYTTRSIRCQEGEGEGTRDALRMVSQTIETSPTWSCSGPILMATVQVRHEA